MLYNLLFDLLVNVMLRYLLQACVMVLLIETVFPAPKKYLIETGMS